MWLSEITERLAETGARAIQFFRTGYPESFPRRGFIAAVALLPERVSARKDADSIGGEERP
jgi:hypothetical protein